MIGAIVLTMHRTTKVKRQDVFRRNALDSRRTSPYVGKLGEECISIAKDSIQPQVPLRLPCYDFTPVEDPTVVCANKTTKDLSSRAPPGSLGCWLTNHLPAAPAARLAGGALVILTFLSAGVVSHSEDFIDQNAATKGLPRDLASSKVRLRARFLK
ncbi:hypothetical protein KY284_020259 [Solanum tuberosum]|nr:hypothetical protein KY284_020259 [Solanum tuberosum]